MLHSAKGEHMREIAIIILAICLFRACSDIADLKDAVNQNEVRIDELETFQESVIEVLR